MILEGKHAGYNANTISITAPAPYFCPSYGFDDPIHSLSWFGIPSNMSSNQWKVNRLNLDMMHQSSYQTYDDIFVKNEYSNICAVKQISELGVSSSHSTVLKSVSEVYNYGGYIDPTILGGWGCQANKEFGWTG